MKRAESVIWHKIYTCTCILYTIIRLYLPSLEEDIYIKNVGKYQI